MSEDGMMPTTDQQSPGARLAMTAICFVAGAAIVALAAGVIPADEAKFHAPHWVVGACGGVFMLAGVMIWMPPTLLRMQNFLGAVLLSLFASVFGWVAFGPGPREFSGSASFGGMTTATHPDASTGRIVFGIAAVLISMLAAYAWVRWLRSLFAVRENARDGETAGRAE